MTHTEKTTTKARSADWVDIDDTRYVESCLLRYENITTKIRMYYDRAVFPVLPSAQQTYNRHATTALNRAHKSYNALTAILKPTLEGWKAR